ncbi:hypothetical protein AB0E88_15460 [Streptomyces sp. NPDC028635]|uniref:hypothetical protein n=1 Tax=Streptomyces sp. NPDC028635 TaxID=3154800 RepID=UPI0033E584B8
MAHAAPAPGSGRTRGSIGTRLGALGARRAPNGLPDVFSERTHTLARYGVPVVLGLVYGYWAAANRRGGGPITGWNLLFGFVTAIVFIVACIGVALFAPRLTRELHSGVKSAFAGISIGFLYSQTGDSILRSVALGLITGAAIYLVFFYRYYTREDAEGNRIR